MSDDTDGLAFARRLEREALIVLDETYALTGDESVLLSQDFGDPRAKNISLSPEGKVRGAAPGAASASLAAMMIRFAAFARATILSRAPQYDGLLSRGRTSYRPRAIDDRPLSARKDDRRLHADAFASQPTAGARILRVFANINPHGEGRTWRVGEPFADYAARFLSRARATTPAEAFLLQTLGLTRARRTPYDGLMLGLHDAAKLDQAYQRTAPRREVTFPSGAVWIAYTDALVHAAIAGRYALEQTFYLPLSAMTAPEASPARILERLTGRTLC